MLIDDPQRLFHSLRVITSGEKGAGIMTRLYISESSASFVDVPTGEIGEVERDTVTPATPESKPQPQRVRSRVNLDEALI